MISREPRWLLPEEQITQPIPVSGTAVAFTVNTTSIYVEYPETEPSYLYLASLEPLTLRTAQDFEALMFFLASRKDISALNVSDNNITDEQFLKLASHDSLIVLIVDNNPLITDTGINAFIKSENKNIAELSIQAISISPEVLKTLKSKQTEEFTVITGDAPHEPEETQISALQHMSIFGKTESQTEAPNHEGNVYR